MSLTTHKQGPKPWVYVLSDAQRHRTGHGTLLPRGRCDAVRGGLSLWRPPRLLQPLVERPRRLRVVREKLQHSTLGARWRGLHFAQRTALLGIRNGSAPRRGTVGKLGQEKGIGLHPGCHRLIQHKLQEDHIVRRISYVLWPRVNWSPHILCALFLHMRPIRLSW